MGILEFIEKIQRKPEASRKKILLITVFSVMGVIVIVWLTTLNLHLGGREEIKKISEPFGVIKEDINNFYGFFKGIIK